MNGDLPDLTRSNYTLATDRIARWLIENAIHCGYSQEMLEADGHIQASEDRMTGQEKADSKKRISTVRGYGELAEFIAKSGGPVVRLPALPALVLRQTIVLREEKSKEYADTPQLRKRNERHRHFVIELQRVLCMLGPDTDGPRYLRSTSSTLVSTDIVAAVWPSNPKRTGLSTCGAPTVVDRDIQVPKFDEAVAIIAFFEHMNDIHDMLSDVWTDYAAGGLDLMAAAITTDTAFAIIKESCREIAELVPSAVDWRARTHVMGEHLRDCADAPEFFTESSCAKVALCIEYVLDTLAPLLEPGVLVVQKPGVMPEYDPTRDRSEQSQEERDEEDRVIICELLTDIIVLSRCKIDVPAEDELTTGLRSMIDRKSSEDVPMHVIFAVQIYLNIHRIMDAGVTDPFVRLQNSGRSAAYTIEQHIQHTGGRTRLDESDDDVPAAIVDLERWIREDMVGTAFHEGVLGKAAVPPFRLLRHHPILCGLQLFRLQMLLQDFGIKICNDWGSVVSCVHVCNAASYLSEPNTLWEDLEFVRILHSDKRLFAGPPPSRPQDYLDCFTSVLDKGVRDLYAHTRSSREHVKIQRIKLKMTSPVKDVFDPRYVRDGIAAMNPHNVGAMLSVARNRASTNKSSDETIDFLADMSAKKCYTTMELLRVVRESLVAEELHLLFDYAGLHDRATSLLHKLHAAFRSDLEQRHHHADVQRDSDMPLVVADLFALMAKEDQSPTSLDGTPSSTSVLERIVRVVSDFLDEDGNRFVGSRSVIFAMAQSHAGMQTLR